MRFGSTLMRGHRIVTRTGVPPVSVSGGVPDTGDPPDISSVSPALGTDAGGTTLTISGTNLLNASVTVGGSAATISANTATSITCTTPVHAAGLVNVVVTTVYGTDTETGAFTYIGDPVVTGVSPAAGPPDGGGSVTISGDNFLSGATVTFGGNSATNVSVNSLISITCTVPAHAEGAVDIVVTTGSGTGTLTNGYEYGVLSAVFFSDWANAALGGSSTSRSDGGKWNFATGGDCTVVSSTGLDFPSTKCYRVFCGYTGGTHTRAEINRVTGLGTPAVGSTRYYRLYMRMTFDDQLYGNGDHDWQDGSGVGDSNWLQTQAYSTGINGDANRPGEWQAGFFELETGSSINFARGPWLNKNATYRFEMALTRITTTTYSVQIRVYNNSNTLLYTETDFPANTAAGFGTGNVGTRAPFTFKNADALGGFNIGQNDVEVTAHPENSWITVPGFEYGYQGCVAIVDDQGWIGPYGSVNGEVPA